MLDGFIALALLALPLLIAGVAFILEHLALYGMQDNGLMKHRRVFRVVGVISSAMGLITIMLSLIALVETPG